MKMEEKSESETIDLIFCLLASENSHMKLSKLLSGFEREAGHSIPLFGHETVEQFLRSISIKIQVLTVEEDVYVKLNAEESVNSENDHTHDVQKEVNKTNVDVKKVENAVDKVDFDLNKADDAADKVDDKLNKVEDAVDKVDDVNKVDDDVDKVDDDVEKADDKLNKVEDSADKVDDDVEKADDKLNKVEDSADKAEDEVNKVEDAVDKVDNDVEKVEDAVDKVDDDVEKADDKLNKVEDSADKAEDEVNKVDDDVEKADDDVEKADDKLNKVEDSADKAEDEVNKVVDAVDKVDDDVEKADDKLNKVEDSADKAEDEVNKVEDAVDKVDDDVEKADDKLNKVEDSADKAEDEVNKVEDDVEKAEDEVNKVEDAVDKVDDAVKQVDDEVNKVDDDVDEVDIDVDEEDDAVDNEDDPSPLNSAAAAPSSEDIPEEEKSDEESKTDMINEERDDNTSENLNLMSPCGIEEEYDFEESAEKESQEDEDLCEECVPVGEPECEPCIDNCLSTIILDESDIPKINLLDHMKVSDCIRVVVPEVRNPHRFILQLKKYASELTIVMRRMQTLYNLYGEMYTLGDYKFMKNQVCAALYNTNPKGKEWYRAKILNFNPLNCTVLLVDYGIVTHVPNTNIKFLDRDFGYLPMQALNGHLANIKPYKGKYWSEDCCKRFYDAVFEEDLVAQIVRMDTARRWMSVILSYVEDPNILINNNLIKGKFPIADCDFNEDEPIPSMVFDSISPREFIQAEEVGKTRRLKSEFKEREEFNRGRKGRRRRGNKALRKLFETDAREEELSLDAE